MKILIANPILYTAETSKIHKVDSIKDTMIYDLCLAFYEKGEEVTLLASEEFKPLKNEKYPFKIVFLKSILKKIFKPNCFPYLKGLNKYIKENEKNFDLIITSEVFSIVSLMIAFNTPKKTIIWHELAKHNNILFKVPSYFWYNLVARLFYRKCLVIPRSEEAKIFIKKYCNRVSEEILDHGVNLDLFVLEKQKTNTFVVCSQLIKRKAIDGIIKNFNEYLKNTNSAAILYIIGEGTEEKNLKKLSDQLNLNDKVQFLGKLSHRKLLPYLSKAKALLVNTEKDNNLISIVESLAVCTPIITTDIPYNASYIKKYKLGIAKNNWNWRDIQEIEINNELYVKKCMEYRKNLSTKNKTIEFIKISKEYSII